MTIQRSFVKSVGLKSLIGITAIVAIPFNVVESQKTHATAIEANPFTILSNE